MDANTLIVLTTCPDEATAARLATALLDLRLAACVSRVPGLTSWYRWEGRVERDDEVLLLIKTAADRYNELSERLTELHPYDVPELLALDVTRGLPAYLDWVAAETRAEPPAQP